MATQNEISEHLDINPRHVRRLISDGILPSVKGRGGLDIDLCRISYIGYLRGISTGQVKPKETKDDGEKDDDLREELLREQLREKKRENDIAEREVASVDLLKEALLKTASQVIPIMDALPLEMKRRNPKLTGHDIQLVKKSIAKCRNAMADAEIKLED